MASFIYDSLLDDLFHGAIDLRDARFKVMLVTSKYVASKSSHSRRSDVTDEVVGEGYPANGSAVDFTWRDGAGPKGSFDIVLGSAEWPDATITAAGGVYYKSNNGFAAGDELVAFVDFGRDITSTNGTFALTESQLQIGN